MNGNLDVIRGLPTDQIEAINNSGRAKVTAKPILRVGFVRLDAKGRTAPNPFQDVAGPARRESRVDTDGLIKSLQPGGDRTPALVNPLHFGFDPTIKPHEYRPGEGEEAHSPTPGSPSGFDVTWNMTDSNIMPNYKAVFESMQQQLTKVGIRVKFQHGRCARRRRAESGGHARSDVRD